MYYSITSVTPSEVRLDRAPAALNVASKVVAFVFDNVKGMVRVIADEAETEIGTIPYQNIDYFSIKKRQRGKQFYYDVVMHMKNLGAWFLFEYRKREEAEAELKRLSDAIHLDRKDAIPVKPAFPESIGAIAHEGSKTIVRWSNIVKGSDLVKLVLGGMAGGAFIYFILSSVIQEPGAVGGIVLLVFAGFYIAIMYALTKQTLSDKTRIYGLSFGSGEVEYFEERASNGTKTKSQTLPNHDWFALSYPSGVSTTGEDVLMISNSLAANYAAVQKAEDSYLQMQMAFRKLDHYPRIRLKGRSPVQRLAFVNWFNDQMSQGKRNA